MEGMILRERYRLERLLGRGGMAEVYLATDLRRRTPVAVKVLLEDLSEDPEFIARFQREAEALARLDHPNVVRFYSFERQGRQAFIVMDYISGTTLRGRLLDAGGPLPLPEVTRIINQICSALYYAHNEGYVHRDIKPGNIMLREDGTALLSDFGIARAVEATTMTVGALGTPAYMSPEQILGHKVDARSDIYSLGVVLYEMVTGRRPFVGDIGTGTNTAERIREEHLRNLPPDPRQCNPALNDAASVVLARALAKAPAQRWPDVQSFADAWQAAQAPIAQNNTLATQPLPQPVTGAAKRKFNWLPVAIGAVAILLIAAVAVGTALANSAKTTNVPRSLAELTVVSTSTAIAEPPTLTLVPPTATSTLTSKAGSGTVPIGKTVTATATTALPTVTETKLPATATSTATTTATVPPTVTFTPPPTLTPATPTPKPLPVCAVAVDGQLQAGYSRDRLGCALAPAAVVWSAWEPFDSGAMFWRNDNQNVYVLYSSGSYKRVNEPWNEATPSPTRGNPPTGRYAPQRGFGYLWGKYDDIFNGLGWATDEEKGFCALLQNFDNGTIIRSQGGGPCQGNLYNWATNPAFAPVFFSAYNNGSWKKN